MNIKNITLFGLLFTLVLSFLYPQEIEGFPFLFESYQLENGLQVILSEDYSLPLVSIVVAYDVGSMNDLSRKTGLAYLLGSLMFQGSKNVGRMQHISFIHRIGGKWNAVTQEDKTIFFQTVPAHQLALALWLESDRMNSLIINPQRVEQAKALLIEEIEQKLNSDPYLESTLLFDRLLYPHFAHSHPVMGETSNIREISDSDAKNFYDTYFNPNNAVLCICGNFDKTQIRNLISKYFETIPKGKQIQTQTFPDAIVSQRHERTIINPLISAPAFQLGYRIASPYSNDYYTLVLIEYLLLRGRNARLPQRLLKKTPIAYFLDGGIETKKDQATFKIFVIANNETMKERSRKAIQSEINKLKTGMVSDEELSMAKNLFTRDYMNQFSSTANRAIFLTEMFLDKINKQDLEGELSKYLSVKPVSILRAMNKYFKIESVYLDIKVK